MKRVTILKKFNMRENFVLSSLAATIILTGCAGQVKKLDSTAPIAYSTGATLSTKKELFNEERLDYKGREINILREDRSQQIFRDYGVNPTINTNAETVSTFAMDVDTVSYQIARENLNSNRLPNTASIRVEEFVNHFDYNYQISNDDFSISAEIVPSPYRPGFHVLHIGVKAKNIPEKERLPANLVLVADVSGSMSTQNKMELQKKAFITLVSQLKSDDKVAIIAYENDAIEILKPTSAKHKSKIYRAIKRLNSGGGTNAASGIRKGYALAEQMAYPGYINRVILTSDGLANIGQVEPKQILQEIGNYRKNNIFLTTVGVGQGMFNDYLLEQLANQGNGQYLYFSNDDDIQSAFVDGLTTQLQTVAKDAKVQISFDPEVVSHYRQLGYENRALKSEDFLNADKDGGELGANHQVTVLYEVKLKLKRNDIKKDVGKLSISYKKPQGSAVFFIEKSIPASIVRERTVSQSPDTTVALASAAFAEKLRQSYWSRLYTYEDIIFELKALPRSKRNQEKVSEFMQLISQATRLDQRNDRYELRYPLEKISYEQVPLLK